MSTNQTLDDLYPQGRGYHDAHKPYIEAVAAAFDAANIETLDWYADANDPRDGAIQINPDSLDTTYYDEVWVGWQEERGWHVLKVVEGGDGDDDQRYVVDLDCYSLCNPSGVVRSVCEHFGIPPGNVRGDNHPEVDFPEYSFEDDDVAFELALAHYRTEGEIR